MNFQSLCNCYSITDAQINYIVKNQRKKNLCFSLKYEYSLIPLRHKCNLKLVEVQHIKNGGKNNPSSGSALPATIFFPPLLLTSIFLSPPQKRVGEETEFSSQDDLIQSSNQRDAYPAQWEKPQHSSNHMNSRYLCNEQMENN